MRKLLSAFVVVTCVFFVSSLNAGTEKKMEHKAPPLPQEMTQLHQLVGNWEGMNDTEMGRQNVKVSYELTSGQTALLEKTFEGTPHEMVSVYHTDGKKVLMTHYCMIGNQPRMALKKHKGNSFYFKYKDGTGMKKSDPHMHSLKLTLEDKDHLRQEWTMYEKKKPTKTVVFNFTRKN